jgi:hypothetical protein
LKESEIRTPCAFPAKTRKTQPKETTQQRDDGKGTMMVHSRRRIGFHGHQAMESTNNSLIEGDSEAFYYVLALFFSIFVCFFLPSFLP